MSENKSKVQLSGESGNGFLIIAKCRKAAKKAGWSNEKIVKLTEEMQASTYDNLLAVAIKYFDVD